MTVKGIFETQETPENLFSKTFCDKNDEGFLSVLRNLIKKLRTAFSEKTLIKKI